MDTPEPPPLPGSARLLVGGTATYARMLELIGAARSAVKLETYIYRADAIGARFLTALVDAARRGVRVRVLVDAYGSDELPTDFFSPLLAAGGEFRWFNPKRLLHLSFRDHRKLLCCDDVACVGGINVGEEYDGDGFERGWRDFAVEVTGPVLEPLADSFERMWELAPFGREQVRHFWKFRRSEPPGNGTTAGMQVLLSGPGCPTAELRGRLGRDILMSRRCTAWVAYFLPSRRLGRAIRAAARRGQVRLMLGKRTDVPLARWASERHLLKYLKAHVQVYEYHPQVVHAKALITDDVVFIGSANLDVRSLRINYELLLRIESPALAARLREEFARDVMHAPEIDRERWSDARPWWHSIRSWFAYQLLGRLDPYVATRKLKSLR